MLLATLHIVEDLRTSDAWSNQRLTNTSEDIMWSDLLQVASIEKHDPDQEA